MSMSIGGVMRPAVRSGVPSASVMSPSVSNERLLDKPRERLRTPWSGLPDSRCDGPSETAQHPVRDLRPGAGLGLAAAVGAAALAGAAGGRGAHARQPLHPL